MAMKGFFSKRCRATTKPPPPPPPPIPGVPTGLVVSSVGSGTVSLDWQPSSNATSYKVYQGIGTGTLLATVTSSQATITGLTNGTLYTFTVRAVNVTGMSVASASVTAKPIIAVPSTPTGLVVSSVGSGTVSLDWTDTANATSYKVYQGTGTTTLLATVTSSQATITGLTNGTPYTFTVRAANAIGSSGASAAVTATPAVFVPPAPTGLVVSSISSGTVSLDWADTANATSYNVYQGTGTTTLLATISTSQATITGLTNGTPYTFTVRAINSAGMSVASTSVTATPVVVVTPPAAPTGFSVISVGSGTVSLDWADASGATSYNVYQGTGTTTLLATVTLSQATITGLTNGTPYTFTVRAINSAGMSVASTSVTATPVAPLGPPATPIGLVVSSVASGTVSLDWSDTTDATSYNVYQGTGTTTLLATVTSSQATITGLTNGTSYTFTVRAVNSAGSSGASVSVIGTPNVVSNPPAIPTGLAVSSVGSGTVSLNWDDPVVSALPLPTLVQQKFASVGAAAVSASVTLTTPVNAGDLIWMILSIDKAAGYISVPGFVSVRKFTSVNVSTYIGYKVAVGGETTVSASWDTASPVGSSIWVGEYAQDGTGDWGMDVDAWHPNDASIVQSWGTNTTGATKRPGLALAYAMVDSANNVATGLAVTNGYTIQHAISLATSASEMIIAVKELPTVGVTTSATFSWTTIDTDQVNAGVIVFGRKTPTNTTPWTLGWLSDIDIDGASGGWRTDVDNAWNRLIGLNPDLIVLGGDSTNDGGADEFAIAKTHMQGEFFRVVAVPGNHDYDSATGGGIGQWWNAFGGGNATYPPYAHGASSAAPWFSFNKNGWHVVCLAINTSTACPSFASGSTQYNWLAADLAANSGKPLLVLWHSPRYATDDTHGDYPETAAMWALVQSYHAEVILNGHVHIHHRYPPANSNGTTNIDGPMEFTNSGVDYRPIGLTSVLEYDWRDANSADRSIMILTLRDTGFDWAHHRVSDGTVIQRGTAGSYYSTSGSTPPSDISYNVYQGTGTTTLLATVTSSQATLTGLTNGTPYTFTVRAVNSSGMSGASASVTATPVNPVSPPAAPTGLSVSSVGSNTVSLDWAASSGATSYNVYQGTGTTTLLATVTSSQATLTGLTNGTLYTFTVRAVNSAGSSGASSSVTATPVASTNNDYIDPNSNTLPGPMIAYPDNGGGPSVGGMYGNTGVLGTPVADGLVISTATSISGIVFAKRFTNRVTVSGADTIAKYCVFEKGVDNTQSGFKMWYCNVGTRTGRPARAMNLKNTTMRRCNIMGYTDLMATSGNMDVRDCFMHDCWETYDSFFTGGPLNTHSDVNQTSLGDSYTFKHNRIYCWMFSEGIHAQAGDQMESASVAKSSIRDQTAGLAFYGASGRITNILVEDCLIRGYASVYVTGKGKPDKPNDVQYMTVKDCRFGPSTEMVSGKVPISTGGVLNLTVSNNKQLTLAEWNAFDNSTPGPTVPAAPTGLSVSSVGSNTVSLDWADTSGATSYNVYQGTGTTTLLATVTLSQATITGLNNGTLYTFTVRAVNSAGSSGASASVTATPVVSLPSVPTSFVVTSVGDGTVSLDWAASSNATSYNVYQGNGTTTLLATVTVTQATLTGLTNGTLYTFTVRAVNTVGMSGASASVTATPSVLTAAFPGHIKGKIYLGQWASDANWDSYLAQMNNPTYDGVAGTSSRLGLSRLFGTGREDTMTNNNILVHLSAKPENISSSIPADVPGWNAIAGGSYDSAIRSYFTPLVALNKPLVFTFHHEPTFEANAYSNPQTAAGYWVNAFIRIIDVVNANWPSHKIVWAPNIEENRFRNPQNIRLAWFHPLELMNKIDYWTFDFYQIGYGSRAQAISDSPKSLFSYRINTILDFFQQGIDPGNPGGTPISYMNYTVGTDLFLGVGEHAGRPKFFDNYEKGIGGTSTTPDITTITAAKWVRDAYNYIFSHPTYFHTVAWFNENTGAEDERLVPNALSSGQTNGPHPDWTLQTGDTETEMAIYQSKMNSAITTKLLP